MMGYAKVKNLDDFMKGKGYIKKNDLFVLPGEVIEESERIQQAQSTDNTNNHIANYYGSQAGVTGHLATLQDVTLQEKLINLLNQYEEYEGMLKWYKSQGSQMGGDIVIRLDAKIWSRFKDVAEDKFRHIDNPSLLSQALYEFLEKYDK